MFTRLVILLLAAPASLLAQSVPNRVAVKPPLTRATVYLNGTALEHRATVALAAGLNRVVVSGLSPRLGTEDLEAQWGEGAELLFIDDDDEQLPPPTPLYPTAADSLSRATAEQRTLEGELDGLKQEKAFLLANQTLPSGTQANWSAEVQRGAALMRQRLPTIQQETSRAEARLAVLKTDIAQVQPRASQTSSGDRQVLVVRAAHAGMVTLTLHYFLNHRSPWLPALDIRADASGRAVRFVTRGRLSNRTGLDWQRLPVVLMRYEVADVKRPELTPWELDFDGGDHNGEGRVDEYVVKGTAKGHSGALATQGTRYEVPEPITLASGGRRELTLPPVSLPAHPEYLAVPRVSEQVVLQTKVSGWEGLQLPDRASVYHDGVYVGRTDLDDRAFNDSLEVTLGTDPQLVVGRAKLEDFSGNVPLSDKRRVRLSYQLNVLNRHAETVHLRLLDEVPISEEKEIDVKVLEASGAELDKRTGKLTWLLTLPPGTNQRLVFTFQVDYPKDKQVEIINHRVRISNPKFR
ncbi:DUF4139 domain-containing protein [Hymenobacter sp. RP-2-7]|uniref:DUF4139 domain-containing protein n=1 Tax=Hymenobacter polaris TaxID=2682546 RepID=A0A7Y0AHH3_9BACT|nr:DUF4139 domain-containing protein [Hymenobacter polaris]NML67374.1 DUF4139 domain-containing protein [Hymenobacter polaris]